MFDKTHISQFLIFIRDICNNFKITDQFLLMHSVKSENYLEEYNFLLAKFISVPTHGLYYRPITQ